MVTKAERDLEAELGPSPWTMYEDREEPHKDHALMLKLNEKFDYQYEIAHVLDVDESKISYWMQKAVEWGKQEALKTGELCQRCEDEEVPGGEETGNGYCEDCLSDVRLGESARPEVGG